ncbi:MAG TPA: AIR synthase-related protein, partial [Methylophilaceae bacterium]|nr:AIR synthase-related protein [Methylophilaceae bacterium]
GMAHITGGGITENIPRVLPEGLTAEIKQDSWQLPPLFQWLQEQGNVTDDEMYRTFNCGIGMAVIVSAQDAEAAKQLLAGEGEQVFTIGRIRRQQAGEAPTIVV